MQSTKKTFSNTDEYIAMFPDNIRSILQRLRAAIKKSAPGAEEVISYNMPAFRFEGMLVWFAVNKQHIGFYPTASPIKAFKKELTGYKTSKGAIQFPLDKSIPLALVKKIVKFKVKENSERAKARGLKKRPVLKK